MKVTALPSDQLSQIETLSANVSQAKNPNTVVELRANCTIQNQLKRLFKRSRSCLFNSSRVINLALLFYA